MDESGQWPVYFEETPLQMKEILHRNDRTYALIFKQADGREL